MEKSKLCAIVFHEMAIKEHLSYDVSKDWVQGVEDLGYVGITQNIVNHACQCFFWLEVWWTSGSKPFDNSSQVALCHQLSLNPCC